jgi:hypothetical protein
MTSTMGILVRTLGIIGICAPELGDPVLLWIGRYYPKRVNPEGRARGEQGPC